MEPATPHHTLEHIAGFCGYPSGRLIVGVNVELQTIDPQPRKEILGEEFDRFGGIALTAVFLSKNQIGELVSDKVMRDGEELDLACDLVIGINNEHALVGGPESVLFEIATELGL